MIHSFSAKNFLSFKDKVQIDFTVDNKAPRENGWVLAKSGTRVSFVEAVIGPNASGKTTALKALAFTKWLIVDAYRADRFVLPYRPYIANGSPDTPTELNVTFELDGDVYSHTFVLSKERILSEDLRVRTKSQVRTTYKKLFSRTWDGRKDSYDVIDRNFNLPWNYEGIRSKELGNSSLIGAARRFGHNQSKMLSDYWDNVDTNIDIEDSWTPPYQYGAMQALRFYERHKKNKMDAEAIIRRYDLGIDSIDEDGYINHNFGGKRYKVHIESESSGTQQLLTLIRMIENVIENGGIAIIDEFGAYLHPAMFKELINKFNNPDINRKHAQLLLSTHSSEILNELRKYQILLTVKDRGASSISRLDTVKGVRPSEDFRANYMGRKYGALPRLEDRSPLLNSHSKKSKG